MGIAENFVRWLMQLVDEHGLSGSCLTLGKTDIEFNERKLLWLLAERGLVEAKRPAPGQPIEFTARSPYQELFASLRQDDRLLASKPSRREGGLISDVAVYRTLGFDTIHSLDVNDYEGADIAYDLNVTGIERILPQAYDLVTNLGTLEHVFHLPNALRNIFHAVKVGGHILHGSPANNWLDHGFYQISPTFYYDYYWENSFKVKLIQLHQLSKELPLDLWSTVDYRPGLLDALNHGGLDSSLYNVVALVQKTEKSTWEKIPTQRIYREGIWLHNRAD
jgi:hypothetical protein